jgi:hypothetical protein
MDELTLTLTVAQVAALLELVNAGREALDDQLDAEDVVTIHELITLLNASLEGRLMEGQS